MALTASQLSDMQGDIGITNDQAVFTDAELNRLFERASSDYNTGVYLAYRQLMADAAKLYSYTVAQTKYDKAAVFEHVKAMVEFWRDESLTAQNQVAVVGVTPIPPNWKEIPATELISRRNRRMLWRVR